MECIFCGKIISDDSVYCLFCRELADSSPKIVASNRSVNNKTREELIKLIHRKDKTERTQNKKIQELMQKLSSFTNTDIDGELRNKANHDNDGKIIIE